MGRQRRLRNIDWGHRRKLDAESEQYMTKITEILGFRLTDWQAHAFETIQKGHDLIIKAPTGAGKTAAILSMLAVKPDGIILVVVPIKAIMSDAKKGIKAAILTAESLRKDRTLWDKVDAGVFQVVYATVEVLLNPKSHFMKITIGKKKGTRFREKLALMVMDEAHSIWEWCSFRKMFKHAGFLHLCFPNVPVVGMSATFPPHVIAYFLKIMKLKEPTDVITVPGRKINQNLLVAVQPGKKDIQLLLDRIPETLESPQDVCKTVIFVDNVTTARYIATSLRKRLEHKFPCRFKPAEVIRTYYSFTDDGTKEITMKLLRDGQTRIVVATDAFSMGVDIRDIECAIQWGVDSKLTLSALQQRLGRAARDPSMQGVGVIYAPKSLLFHLGKQPVGNSGGPETVKGDDEEEEQEWEDIVEQIGIITDNRGRDLEELCLAVESGKMKTERVRQLCMNMYRKADDLRRAEEEQQSAQRGRIRILSGGRRGRRLPTDNIDPGILWLLNTLGCRHRMLMAYFGYPDVFDERKEQLSWCCDRCATTNNLAPDTTSTSGIRLESSAIYYTETKATKKASQLPPVCLQSECFKVIKPFIKDSLEKWRTVRFNRLVRKNEMDPETVPAQFLLSDSVIESVIRGCNRELDLEYIKLLFVKAGVSLTSSTLRGKDFVDISYVIKATIARHSPLSITPDVIGTDSVVTSQSNKPTTAPPGHSGVITNGRGAASWLGGTCSLTANSNLLPVPPSRISLDTTSEPKAPTPEPPLTTLALVSEASVCTSQTWSVSSETPSETVDADPDVSVAKRKVTAEGDVSQELNKRKKVAHVGDAGTAIPLEPSGSATTGKSKHLQPKRKPLWNITNLTNRNEQRMQRGSRIVKLSRAARGED